MFIRRWAINPICLLRVKVVPSEEDSAPCGVLADPVQSLVAIDSVNYAFLSNYYHSDSH